MSDYLYPIFANYGKDLAEREYHSSSHPNVNEYEDAVILPMLSNRRTAPDGQIVESEGGVMDCNGKYVESSALLTAKYKKMYGGYEPAHIAESTDTVVYLGLMYAQWGHFLIDSINRIWYAFRDGVDFHHLKFAYCRTPDFFVSGHFEEFFSMLGIQKNQLIPVDTPTRFQNVIVPDASLVSMGYYTDEYLSIIGRLKKASEDCSTVECREKVFFTRTAFLQAVPKERGCEEIERFFRDNGFTVIAPEKLTLKEQVHILIGCKVFASIGGTAPHMLMFASPGCKAIICNKTDHPVPYQYMIDHLAGLKDVSFIDSFFGPYKVQGGGGPFVMYCSDELKRFALNNGYVFNPSSRAILNGNIKWYLKRYKHINGNRPEVLNDEDRERYEFFKPMMKRANMSLLDTIAYRLYYFRRDCIQFAVDFRRINIVNNIVLRLRKDLLH